jgi:large subunit ribosomal protein L6
MAKEQLDILVEVPAGIVAVVEGSKATITGPRGSISRAFKGASIKSQGNSVIIRPASKLKKDIAVAGSIRAHLRNMMRGVSSGVVYNLKVVYSHFPMNVKVSGNRVLIDNFLGEKHPRSAEILQSVSVEVKGQDVKVSGFDKEKVSQTAANIEQATRIKRRDPRVFQDGIYIIEKDGKSLLSHK